MNFLRNYLKTWLGIEDLRKAQNVNSLNQASWDVRFNAFFTSQVAINDANNKRLTELEILTKPKKKGK